MASHSDPLLPARDIVLGVVSVFILGYSVLTANLLLGALLIVALLVLSLLYRLVLAVEKIAEQV